jgi:hypothetical protein
MQNKVLVSAKRMSKTIFASALLMQKKILASAKRM